MLSKTLFLLRAIFFKYWSTPMVTIQCLICLRCNTPFSIIYWFLNDPILKIISTTLDSDIDLAHYAICTVFLSVLNHKYSFPDGGSFIL